jgi:hypothetical protein
MAPPPTPGPLPSTHATACLPTRRDVPDAVFPPSSPPSSISVSPYIAGEFRRFKGQVFPWVPKDFRANLLDPRACGVRSDILPSPRPSADSIDPPRRLPVASPSSAACPPPPATTPVRPHRRRPRARLRWPMRRRRASRAASDGLAAGNLGRARLLRAPLCFICIMAWARVDSRSPFCKARFRTIRRPPTLRTRRHRRPTHPGTAAARSLNLFFHQ